MPCLRSCYTVWIMLLKKVMVPPFLAVIDTAKAAIMKTTDVMSLFKKNIK